MCDGNQFCPTCQAGRLREESKASESHPEPKLPTLILGLQACLVTLEGFWYGLPPRTRPENRGESYRTHGDLRGLVAQLTNYTRWSVNIRSKLFHIIQQVWGEPPPLPPPNNSFPTLLKYCLLSSSLSFVSLNLMSHSFPVRHASQHSLRSSRGVTGALCSAHFTLQSHFLTNSKVSLPQRIHIKKLIFFPKERRAVYPAPRGGHICIAVCSSVMLWRLWIAI